MGSRATRLLAMTLLLAGAGAVSGEEAQPPVPPPPAPPSYSFQRGRLEKDGIVTIFYTTSHERGGLLQPFLQRFLTPKGAIVWSEKIHMLMVSDAKENIDLVERVLEILDRPDDQIAIEAQIIEKNVDSDLDIGAELTATQPDYGELVRGGSAVFNPDGFLQSLSPGATPYQGATLNMFHTNYRGGTADLKIRAAVRRGQATILSNPYVTVNNGETATLSAGQDVPIPRTQVINNVTNVTIEFKAANVELVVVPHVIGGNYIDLDIKPTVSNVTGSVTILGAPTPVFSTRKADTHLTVPDGQQIVIGGLVRTEEQETHRGIPLISEIPIIGSLFGSTRIEKRKTEILFIIRPRIVKGAAAHDLLVPPKK